MGQIEIIYHARGAPEAAGRSRDSRYILMPEQEIDQ
jgi:hypothetical protein